MKLESTGRELDANGDIIGIAPDGELFGGYDQLLEEVDDPLTAEERVELAVEMMRLWRKVYEEALEAMTEGQ